MKCFRLFSRFIPALFPLFILALAVTCLTISPATSPATERIIVIGDSITGHSMNLEYGFTHQIRAALAESGQNEIEFIPLGGSGRSVLTWLPLLAQSRTTDEQLDIPGIFVKQELDKNADTVIIFLGMNDAGKSIVNETPESLLEWKKHYQNLINTLRARFTFKKLILVSPTMMTESPYHYKNRLMDQFTPKLEELARENNALFVNLRAEFKKHFENARLLRPEIRFTRDFIHPNEYGHQIITWSLLQGIGQKELADKYYVEKVDPILRDFSSPGMNFFVLSGPEQGKIKVQGQFRGLDPASITVTPPTGITLDQMDQGENGSLTLTLSGCPATLAAPMTVTAGEMTRTVLLNPPYYVLANFSMPEYRIHEFDPKAAWTPIDQDILDGKDPLQSVLDGKPTQWTVCYPTPDNTGGNNPNAIDFTSIPLSNQYDAAYAVRHVWSPKEQTANLSFSTEGFSTTAIATIYLNAQKVWFGQPNPSDQVAVPLKEGLNTLAVRVDHTQWQWAMSFTFNGEGLTYAPQGNTFPQ